MNFLIDPANYLGGGIYEINPLGIPTKKKSCPQIGADRREGQGISGFAITSLKAKPHLLSWSQTDGSS